MKMNIINITALNNLSMEPVNELTSLRILGNALILRRGLKTLSVLSALTLNQLIYIISIKPVITTTKSSQLHTSRKYEL